MRTKEQTSDQNRRYHERNKDKIHARHARNRERRRTSAEWRTWVAKRMVSDARLRARQRGMAFSITVADIEMPDVCPVFGLPLTWSGAERTWSSPSLDRIDSRIGYVPGNVWVISWRANAIKSDATPRELRAVARAVDTRLRARRKTGGVITLPYLDGVQHEAIPRSHAR